MVGKRLEFYNPEGRWDGHNIHNEHITLYNYFVRNLRQRRALDSRVCKVWSSDKVFQGVDMTCALWSSVFAICRMSGIDRSQLPSDLQVVKNISRSVLDALWNTCDFKSFQILAYNKAAVETALRKCVVPRQEIESIRKLVMETQIHEPVAIPDDVNICDTPVKRSEQKINCADVVVDTYENPLSVELLPSLCVKAEKISFKGTPRDFPKQWFSLTKSTLSCNPVQCSST